MKILDFFKNLVYRNKYLRLNESDSFGSIRVITIDTIEAIIKDSEMYKKFMDFNSFRDIFGENIKQIDYIYAIKSYADFMKENHMPLSRQEKRRVKSLLKAMRFPKKTEENHTRLYDGVDRKILYETVEDIIRNPTVFQEYLSARSSFRDIKLDTLHKYIIDEFEKLYENGIVFPSEVNNRYLSIRSKALTISKADKTNIDLQNLHINENFEKAIMEKIDPNLRGAELAFAIYNELNKRVKYNSAFFALDENLEDEFAKSIYYQDQSSISEADNQVVCSTYSELLAYFLNKNGLESYVMGEKKHKYVVTFCENMKIIADATKPTYSEKDNFRLMDLTRAKLGMRPAGFQLCDMSDLSKNIQHELDNMQFDNENDCTVFKDTQKLQELMDLIDDDRDLSSIVLGLDNENNSLRSIMNKLNFINSLMKKSNLDGMDSVGYLKGLFNSILSEDEKKRAHLKNSLCENLYTDCKVLPTISIDKHGCSGKGQEETQEDNYVFLILDGNNNELRKIDKQEIIDGIITGRFERIKAKSGYMTITGIPEDDITESRNITNNSVYKEQFERRDDGPAK